MDIGLVSVRYAKALLKFALEEHTEDRVYGEISVLYDTYLEVPALRSALENPTLGDTDKEALLSQASGGNVSNTLLLFIRLVISHHRTQIMQFIASSYVTLYRKNKKLVQSRLTVPSKISEALMQRIKELIKSRTSSDVEFLVKEDKSLIGGFVLEYDTYRMDVSLKNQFQKLRNEFQAINSK